MPPDVTLSAETRLAAKPLAWTTDDANARVVTEAQSLRIGSKPLATALLLILSDLLMLSLAAAFTVELRLYFDGQFYPSLYWKLWPVLGLFLIGNAGMKLYPGAPLSVPEEMRRVFVVVTVVYLALGTLTFLGQGGKVYSRTIFLGAWAVSIFLVLISRAMLRLMFSHRSWWGYGAVIFGAGTTGRGVVKLLLRQPEIGLKPVAMVDDKTGRRNSFGSVPVIGDVASGLVLGQRHRSLYAIVAMSDLSNQDLLRQLAHAEHQFNRVIVVPDLSGITTLGVAAKDLGGMLGLEIRQRLLDPYRLAMKRGLDLFLVLLASPILILTTVLIAVLIKLDSPGPVFYGHERIGFGGRRFKAYKFRSMVANADQVLAELQENEKACSEWKRAQKLKDDPRITRIGKFLRKTSIDELPQIWNVLTGEMSLVGPRPIVDKEVQRYGENFGLYLRVRPGITGLWQVSGRNDLTYAERVRLDVYYVRNWSVWLDLYLLSRTIMPVIYGNGAY